MKSSVKILLVQTAFLGDLVLSTPVIDGIKELYPEAKLSLLTTPAGKTLFEGDPRLETVEAFEKRRGVLALGGLLSKVRQLRSEKYDIAFSLHRSFRTSLLLFLSRIPTRIGFADAHGAFLYTERAKRIKSKHAVERFLSLLYAQWIGGGLNETELFNRDLSLASLAQPTSDACGAIVLVPGSAWKTKQWNWNRYRELSERLLNEGERVVLAGSAEERALCETIRDGRTEILNVAGELSLQEFVALVRFSKALVCNDSFALHVASATRVPCVSIFCATSPEFGFGPWRNPNAKVVPKDGLWCKPCRRHGSNSCPTGTEHCMRGVGAEEVRHELFQILRDSEGGSTSPSHRQFEQKVAPV